MGKRVAVLLSGCGAGDGTDIHEALLILLGLDRIGAQAICAAPALDQRRVFDHLHTQDLAGAPPRQALLEAARIARGNIRELGGLDVGDFDALIVPGGNGVAEVLSNYAEKAQLCEVHPHLVQLLKTALGTHRPMGFIGLGAVLAARVLGPVAGVRVTLGPRTASAIKHAAVMGADVRPCAVDDICIDRKNRVVTTGAFLHEDIRLRDAAQAVEKLVRTVVHLARDRASPAAETASGPAPRGKPSPPAPARRRGVEPSRAPAPPAAPAERPSVFRRESRRPTPGRGSA
jgi:enhancing lycopene biosynthesis protein 2